MEAKVCEELDGILDSLKRARTQYKMLCDWVYYSDEHRVEGVPRTEFIQKIGSSASALKGLCERGVLEIVVQEVSRLRYLKRRWRMYTLCRGHKKKFWATFKGITRRRSVSCCRA